VSCRKKVLGPKENEQVAGGDLEMLDFRDGDIDPIETREWVGALQSVLDNEGSERLHFLLERLTAKARELGVAPENSIRPDSPGKRESAHHQV